MGNPTDPVYTKNPLTISGTYQDVNGDSRSFTVTFNYPETNSVVDQPFTKREDTARMFFAAMLSNPALIEIGTPEALAAMAIERADIFLSTLENM